MSITMMKPVDMMEAKRAAEARRETPEPTKPEPTMRVKYYCPETPRLKTYSFWKAVVAEFVAMTLFCYVGIGTAMSNFSLNDNPNAVLVTAFGFGLAITTLVYVTAHTSTGHINPAVTLALVILGECHWLQGLIYMFVQFGGAILGVLIVSLQSPGLGEYGVNKLARYGDFSPPNCTDCDYTYNAHPRDVSAASASLAEMMGTFLLVYVVAEVAVNRKSVAKSRDPHGLNFAPLAVGLAVFLAHIVLIPITGCGINPARSFGAFFVSIFSANCNYMPAHEIPGGRCHSHDLVIFIVMPFVGGTLAALWCLLVFQSNERTAEVKDREPEKQPSPPYPIDRYTIGTNEETKNSEQRQKVPTPNEPISPLTAAKPHQIVPQKKKTNTSSPSSSDSDHDDPQYSESKNRSS